ncbi:MAG: nucleotide exchange factor GrpE [Acidobacteriota bacterium]
MESRKIPINSTKPPAPAEPAVDTFEESAEFKVVDKRHFANVDEVAISSGPVEEKPRYPSYVEELMARTAETERRYAEKVKQIDQEVARVKARLEAEHERQFARARQDLLLPFLEVLDNLERALRAESQAGTHDDLVGGLKMTVDLFRAKLKKQEIEPVEVLGLPFDPNVSQAIGVVPVLDRAQDGVVVEELLRGYRMGDSLVRPAQVRVGQYQDGRSGPAW